MASSRNPTAARGLSSLDLDDERKQLIQRLVWLLVTRRRQKLNAPPKPKCKGSEAIGCAVMVGLVIAGIWWAFSACQPSAEERIEKEKETLEEKRRGFHCLNVWDGHHNGLEGLVRPLLTDPGSMKTYKTLIGPVRNGQHNITMDFGSRNSFGGMVRMTAKGTVDHRTCKASLTELY